MEISQINQKISLDPETHTYSWDGKDESIPCFCVSEILYGRSDSRIETTAMLKGTAMHKEIQNYVETNCQTKIEEDTERIIQKIRHLPLEKSTCELPSASSFKLGTQHLYICGTPDIIVDDMIVEIKTGNLKSTNHILQIKFYALLKGLNRGALVYKDAFMQFDNLIDDAFLREAENLIELRLFNEALGIAEAQEIEDEDLEELYLQKQELSQELKVLQDALDCKTSAFGPRTIVNGTLEIKKQFRNMKTFDKDLIANKLPEAISFKKSIFTTFKRGGKCSF